MVEFSFMISRATSIPGTKPDRSRSPVKDACSWNVIFFCFLPAEGDANSIKRRRFCESFKRKLWASLRVGVFMIDDRRRRRVTSIRKSAGLLQ